MIGLQVQEQVNQAADATSLQIQLKFYQNFNEMSSSVTIASNPMMKVSVRSKQLQHCAMIALVCV
jgi:hypothetical protein